MKPHPLTELCKLLKESGAAVRVGLRQQGHMSTVESMLAEGKSWNEIGKAIGWHGSAVKTWYDLESC